MARAARVVMGSLGVGLLFVFLNSLHTATSQAEGASSRRAESLDAGESSQAKREPVAAPDAGPDVQQFLVLLGKLRANDESVVPALRELAEKLCTAYERCDGKDILAYYVSIAPEARARGAEESDAVNEIWSGFREKLERGSADPDWDRVREEATERLREIADRMHDGADILPGATALSCLAFVETDRLQREFGMSETERAKVLATAREDAQRALAAFAKCGMVVPKIQPMYLLAHLHTEAGEDREAYAAFQECLALARKLKQTEPQEKIFYGLLNLARRAGDLAERAELLEELATIRTPEQSWVLTREHALLLLEQDLGSSTVGFLVDHPRSDPSQRREAQILLAGAYLRQGDLAAARDAYATAEPPPWGPNVRFGMALIDIRSGNAERALEQLSQPEFLEDPHPLAQAYALEFRGDALVKLQRYEEATRDLEKALGIGGRLQSHFEPDRDLLGAATSVIGEGVGVHAIALLAEAQVRSGHALEAARSIESWQSRTLRRQSASSEDISTDDLVSWARFAGSGLVTWVVGAESSVVVFVAPDGTAEGVPIPRGRRAIEAAVRRLNDAVRGNDRTQAERLAAEVSAGVMPPSIARRVDEAKRAGNARILFLVHGPIERLPFEFLFRDDSVVPLVLPGLPEPRPGDSIASADLAAWHLLGNPVDTDGRAFLPGAREELAVVAALHGEGETRTDGNDVQARAPTATGIQVSTGTAFNRAALMSALAGNHPIHVATHLVRGCGRKQKRMADVGLELSAGQSFCAQEIVASRPRLPLAVLDACETAEGGVVDAEGLQGVARAFLESGTRNLLVTLWPVEDQAARTFAEAFHRELLAGRRPSEASASARAVLRDRGFPAADWAAFRFLGRD
ncbi:MAG TPA: CHAT domain-containing protein [Planctomycetota bacterium]|nr:CHAT domain-containing protein [Planctomycetota bacterium]